MPKSLLLFEQKWSVNQSAKVGDDGECIPQKCQLNIGDHVCEQARGEVFFHELLHALLCLTGMSDRLKGEDIEEDLCKSIGPAMFAALKRNRLRFDC